MARLFAAGVFGIIGVAEVGISVATLDRPFSLPLAGGCLGQGTATVRLRGTAASRLQAVILTGAMIRRRPALVPRARAVSGGAESLEA